MEPGLDGGAEDAHPAPPYKAALLKGPWYESAVFRVAPGPGPGMAGDVDVVVGVSLEPAASVAARVAEVRQGGGGAGGEGEMAPAAGGVGGVGGPLVMARSQPSTLVLAQRIIQNAFNFLASFSGQAGEVEVVPLRAFEEWWRKFESRLRSDPTFLEREVGV